MLKALRKCFAFNKDLLHKLWYTNNLKSIFQINKSNFILFCIKIILY